MVKDRLKHLLLVMPFILANTSGSGIVKADQIERIPQKDWGVQKVDAEDMMTLKPERFIGSVYGEGAFYSGDIDDKVGFLSARGGYNILNNIKEEGVLLFPHIEGVLKTGDSDQYWDRFGEIALGAAYQKGPLFASATIGHREYFDDEIDGDSFLRLLGGYWNRWDFAPMRRSLTSPLSSHLIVYSDAEANTSADNIGFNIRAEGSLDAYVNGDFKAGPFIAGKVNIDSRNEPWNRYVDASGGLKLQKGPFVGYLEGGYRKYIEDEGNDGSYVAVKLSFWVPVDQK